MLLFDHEITRRQFMTTSATLVTASATGLLVLPLEGCKDQKDVRDGAVDLAGGVAALLICLPHPVAKGSGIVVGGIAAGLKLANGAGKMASGSGLWDPGALANPSMQSELGKDEYHALGEAEAHDLTHRYQIGSGTTTGYRTPVISGSMRN